MKSNEHRTIKAHLQAASDICTQQGKQFTTLRQQVLKLVLEAESPLTAYQLLDRLKRIRKSAAPPTIYRALHFLMDQRLVHKVERLNAFIPCTEIGSHDAPCHFLICQHCGSIARIDDPAVSDALMRAAEQRGFHPCKVVVELDGTCAACSHIF